MFKELYNQMLHDMLGSMFRELKDIHQADDWIVNKFFSALVPIIATLMGLVIWFIPIVILHALMSLLTVLLIPFYWISVKVKKILENMARNASHRERRKREDANKFYSHDEK